MSLADQYYAHMEEQNMKVPAPSINIPGYIGNPQATPDPLYWDNYSKGTGNSAFDQYQKFQQGIPQIAPYKSPNSGAINVPLPHKSIPVSDFDYDQLFKQMVKPAPRKTALEELMEDLFDMSEKEQFLIECGYEIHDGEIDPRGYLPKVVIKRKLADGTYKTITNSIDELFIIEAKIKLKNLLLAKATLKFKFK